MHKVASIVYTTDKNEKKKITASYWVENSDYAALISRLDAKRLPGLEKFYGQKDIEYMSAGMMMKFKHVDWKKFSTTFNALKPEGNRNNLAAVLSTTAMQSG